MDEFETVNEAPVDTTILKEKLSNKILYDYRKIVIPELSTKGYKGCNGKICVVGGSILYSGAPFFSALTTLRIGAELCYVLTTKECAKVLKCYSPDLIVYPFLYNDRTTVGEIEMKTFEQIATYLSKKIDAAVIGPGLGSMDQTTIKFLRLIIKEFTKNNVILVFDAESIHFIITNKELFNVIKNYHYSVFTPNKNEFLKMIQYLLPELDINFEKLDIHNIIHYAHILKKHINEANILVKGFYDVFISKHYFFVSFLQDASPKRVGGLGDILAGAVTLFLCWASKLNGDVSSHLKKVSNQENYETRNLKVNEIEFLNTIAVFNGSFFLKSICKEAFKKKYRGIIASDVIDIIPEVFYELYEIKEDKKISIIKT